MLRVLAVLLASQLFFTHADKYRFCIVDKVNVTRKQDKICPVLSAPESKVECVIGNSRLDCLRLISKNKADFTVLEAEDIQVAAQYKSREVFVTNELRYFEKSKYEYEVVAVVKNSANIGSFAQLEGKKFCHPGFGYETNWNDIIGKFFEARVVPQSCESNLTLTENYIKSSSEFFKSACRAGPWVPDDSIDAELKKKYANLCYLCDSPRECSTLDKYWGRFGPLFCLTDGVGDVAWARLDDISFHFGLLPETTAEDAAEDYSFLCGDGSLAPLHKPEKCSWVAKPWPAIVARRQTAEGVQDLVMNISKASTPNTDWVWGLQSLLNSFQRTVVHLDSITLPEDYLSLAPGFSSANSMTHCDPLRMIRLCTTSEVENSKCEWLKEAGIALGIEPKLSCVRARNIEDCLKGVQGNIADIVIVHPNLQSVANRRYGLKPLLFEFSNSGKDKYNVAAVVRKDSGIKRPPDLKGKKACFPILEGVGWNTAIGMLRSLKLLPKVCPYSDAMGQFFSEICAPGLNPNESSVKSLCSSDDERNLFSGETGALHCLVSGKGDVAFISLDTITKIADHPNNETWAANLNLKNFQTVCVDNSTNVCSLNWASSGQVLVKSTISNTRATEIYIAFLRFGNLFGKYYKTQTSGFQLFGEYDGYHDILFHDTTDGFEDYNTLQEKRNANLSYQSLLKMLPECGTSTATKVTVLRLPIFFVMIITLRI